jgi:adenylosuccinate synthase
MGWFDVVATRFGCQVQGATHVVLTNLDVLSYLDNIPVVIGYDTPNYHQDRFPNITRIQQSKPILTTLPGWKVDISKITDYDLLPLAAKQYVDFIERQIGVKIALVSNGPHREQIMSRKSKI